MTFYPPIRFSFSFSLMRSEISRLLDKLSRAHQALSLSDLKLILKIRGFLTEYTESRCRERRARMDLSKKRPRIPSLLI